jgi:hypothetical protein
VLNPSLKFELPTFLIVEATVLKYGIDVTFNDITLPPNYMKIHQSVKKVLGGGQTGQ